MLTDSSKYDYDDVDEEDDRNNGNINNNNITCNNNNSNNHMISLRASLRVFSAPFCSSWQLILYTLTVSVALIKQIFRVTIRCVTVVLC